MRRVVEIRRARRSIWLKGLLIGTLASELLFWSFALGFFLGPSPLSAIELLIGTSGAFAIGAAFTRTFARQLFQEQAQLALVVFEGTRRRRRPIVIFRDHLTVGGELVLKEQLRQVTRTEERVEIVYLGPGRVEPGTRGFTGRPIDLERLYGALLSWLPEPASAGTVQSP